MKSILVREFGDSRVLRLEEVDKPEVNQGGIRNVVVRTAFAGMNYVDIYQREGRYPGITLPFVPGIEAAGIVEATPRGSEWKIGDRVVVTTGVQGTYAEWIAVPEEHLIAVPRGMDLSLAAAVAEQGLTAEILAMSVARVDRRGSALVHAAAGGVGGLLTQILVKNGVKVFGTVSSDEKARWLEAVGAVPIRYGDAVDWADRIMAETVGRGVDWVFDSVGAPTFRGSLEVVAMRGHVVLFGAAGGVVSEVPVPALMAKSLTVSRPVLPHYLADPAALRAAATHLFARVSSGELNARVHATFDLVEASKAQELLASRQALGKILLRT